MWTQIVGKIRLALTPLREPLVERAAVCHRARPDHLRHALSATRCFEIEFDFIDHKLRIDCSDGASQALALRPQSVADFYRRGHGGAARAGHRRTDLDHAGRDRRTRSASKRITCTPPTIREYVDRFWRVLVRCDQVFQEFRAGFIGKVSPVHFFWGSFDLAVTRFSGTPRAGAAGADCRHARSYSHEVISAGFWPGNGGYGEAAFYCYAAPSPAGLAESKVEPAAAFFDTKMGEFLLRYDDVRKRRRRKRHCVHSWTAPTQPPPTRQAGTAPRWSVTETAGHFVTDVAPQRPVGSPGDMISSMIKAAPRLLTLLLVSSLTLPAFAAKHKAAAPEQATPRMAGPIVLHVDLTDAPRHILHAHETIPVSAGPLQLEYPKWIPGDHRPTGPIDNLAGRLHPRQR